ncbi:MAG: ATP-binding protein [Sphingobium sp.]|uniref:ATP-binding protein n=1 Tax=Sphingobium sp. TaxID=1912891 RepID=UPI0029B7DB6F|nr:ATP-binding protein [Sphingobium sp.]MDX3911160.1 ATP-binding protein [Sphingobium sp.]
MVRIALPKEWQRDLAEAARRAARYCPILVRLAGEALPRQDWLEGAARIALVDGVRIGIFQSRATARSSPIINFHGLTVACCLPSIAEEWDRHWSVRIDIVDAPHLKLVLPARKEMVENDALAGLRGTIKQALYRHIGSTGSHRLSHALWREARDLGVILPEATAMLDAWQPAVADWTNRSHAPEYRTGAELIIAGSFGPARDQCAAIAIALDPRFSGKLVREEEAMAGYGWYDALPRISDLVFEVDTGDQTAVFGNGDDPGLTSAAVDAVRLRLKLTNANDAIMIAAPVALHYDEATHWNVEEAGIFLAPDHKLAPEALVDLLDAACFSASDDPAADFWDTQHDRFLLDAAEIATRLLLGDDAAVIERLRSILAYRAQWFVPEGRQFVASIGRDRIDVAIVAQGDCVDHRPMERSTGCVAIGTVATPVAPFVEMRSPADEPL